MLHVRPELNKLRGLRPKTIQTGCCGGPGVVDQVWCGSDGGDNDSGTG